jgi:hypothetical protein
VASIEEHFKGFQSLLASSRDGAGPLRSCGLVWRGVAYAHTGDGLVGRGTGTRQGLNAKIMENITILIEEGWKSVGLQYWCCNMAKKYVKMCHIDKLFPCVVWDYNHNISRMKPSKSISKHFVHRALEVWSVLYLEKSFELKNKNIFSYSMAAMLYVDLELEKKVD